jgi:hypothetical protein
LKESACVQPRLSTVWHTGLSGGAPDSVRCARLVSGELATLEKTSAVYDYNSPDCPVVHRTVRWCTGLSGEPTAASATVGRQIRGRSVARANGRLGAPDCPVCTGQCPVCKPARSYNGRLHQEWKEIAHRTATGTVRCATRQKARFAFQECLQRLLAALGL